MNLVYNSKHEVRGNPVYGIDLAENNLPSLRAQIYKALMGQPAHIDNKEVRIIGVELFATADCYHHQSAGVMVKPILPY